MDDQRDLFLDVALEPAAPLHVAVSRAYAEKYNNIVSSPTSVADDIPSIVCLGCYTHGTKAMRDLCVRQAFLTQDLLAYHHLHAGSDGNGFAVQLVMTNVVPWAHVDAYKMLVEQSVAEVEGVFGGQARTYADAGVAACKADFFCGIVCHFPSLQACISWMCCANNAELKLGCPTLTLQKATFTLIPVPNDVPHLDSSAFDPILGSASPTSSDEVCSISYEECLEFALLDMEDCETEPESHCSLYSYVGMIEYHDSGVPENAAIVPSITMATFIDGHGIPLAFKSLYYRNNKKGGIRNMRCFPQCKRGAHTTTSFCGDLLRLQVHFNTETRPRILGFARFRSAMDTAPPLRAGMEIDARMITDHLRSKESPKEMWMQTKPVEFVSPTHVVYEIRPSERTLSWHYGFHGGNAQMQKNHTHFLEIGFFIEAGDGRLRCIGAAQTPQFRVASSRTWVKE
ncbi:hypothetical protein SPRG_04162 [Saprolegnia parasitica CBS 223.65]|uniref:Uncharacterized protein n=1 Tax=Saprolegnia parasitica (strain CBS 223.65) TaxID=695850 RepID=A0A067CJQ1_SAPPC|nr:hypothetical protein SPRG_04162 [Saprolegnia parasitica CBS 223.65]KDO30974.1 hypothetical protein SPRG_04162 [Saprolegnia parasitica CBS 223.65]|eukprot:XP_012198158.1 hypothetical protein SPRG_04162 [Saprolegnia parasitica CBS 223.65]